MAVFFYNIFLVLLRAGLYIASLFNAKAKKWLYGRKKIFSRLESAIPGKEKIIWMHCASLGEFEQGRPLLESLRFNYPNYKILLTFFSPSGYDVQKNYPGADWVFYLPADGPANAKRFLEIVKPSLVIFVKYEFWYYYLKKVKYRKIPLILVSALFRKEMSFFKWYGGLPRKMLSRFDHLFVQNDSSKKLVDGIGLAAICSVSGDTRFDRVIEIAKKFEPIPLVEKFIGASKAIVAGSTWKEDEEVLQKALAGIHDTSLKWIVAPHEINKDHLEDIQKLFPNAILFSELDATMPKSEIRNPKSEISGVLIIDNIGILSRLYKYSALSYIGGGLKSSGVHNVLEAAAYDKPVIIGPYYEKYREAVGLVKSGGAIVIRNEDELAENINRLIVNADNSYEIACHASKEYVWKNKGATEKILQFIQEKRLLTN